MSIYYSPFLSFFLFLSPRKKVALDWHQGVGVFLLGKRCCPESCPVTICFKKNASCCITNKPRPYCPFLRGFLPHLPPCGTGITGGAKCMAFSYAHTLCTKLPNKASHSKIQAAAHGHQGLWLFSEGEQQVPLLFMQLSGPTADVSLYIYLLYRRHHSNEKG